MNQVLEAHGGLNVWDQKGSVSFQMDYIRGDDTTTEQFHTDLKSRREKISGKGYTMGFDGEDYWQVLEDSTLEPKNVRFLTNLQFYFFAIPFVLADPGVNYENLGEKRFNQETYDLIRVTFDNGTGVASEDQYLLYLDQATHRLAILQYSVTFFNPENAEKYNTLEYGNYREVDGLLVPGEMKGLKLDESTGQYVDGNRKKVFTNISFSDQTPDQQVFARPEGAITQE